MTLFQINSGNCINKRKVRRINTTFQKKVHLIIVGTFLLLLGCIVRGIHESYLDKHQVFKPGSIVVVKCGYYQDCKGPITKEVYSDPVTDRWSIFHPAIFAGYLADITCNDEHIGERAFCTEFLRVIKTK